VSSESRRAAEQAVVREAIKRGWVTVADVAAVRARVEAGGRSLERGLLVELGARLDDSQRQLLREVHDQVLAASTPEAPPAATAPWDIATVWAGQDADAAPRRIGPYEVERELARGGMGAVYLARHVELDRRVALKLLLADAGQSAPERFAREAKALAGLSHPHIVTLYQAGEEGTGPSTRRWMALELMAGGSLQDRLQREGPLEPRVAVGLLEPVARAIAAAHAHGLLHRDLKPANVLLDETGRPKVTDFGIARWIDGRSQQLTATGAVVGTASYAPPEQVVGDEAVDARADVYGLGATLYALLAGRPPFEGGTFMETVTAIVTADPAPPSRHRPDVPPELDLLVLRCLEKKPADRYPTAEALADELGRWLRTEQVETQGPAPGRRLLRSARRKPLAAALAAGSLLVAGALGRAWTTRAPALAPAPTEVVWVAPDDGARTRESSTEVAIDVRGVAEWVEVGDGGPPPRKLREAGRAQVVVPLRPGDNAVTLRWRASTGEAGTIGPRTLRSSPVPGWYWALKEGERPPLPLPEGLDFDPRTSGLYVATADGSELVWVPPGSFDQARPAGDLIDPTHTLTSRPADGPRRATLTRGYFLGRYEVTWAKFDAFCAATGRPKVSRAIDYEMAVQGSELGFHTTALQL
jgi:formylglycine-generating enzyme required for sulfatase activity